MAPFQKRGHEMHWGELEVQKRRKAPKQVSQQFKHIVEDEMPPQHSDFFEGLDYFAISTMDTQGRPWATILSGKQGSFISAVSATELSISCSMPSADPLLQCLVEHNKLGQSDLVAAGLGLDFTNRRRNKVAGVIVKAEVVPGQTSSQVNVRMITNESLGNCPKYITVRSLEFVASTPEERSKVLSSDNVLLHDAAKEIIRQASTVFLATKHIDAEGSTESDAGLNHRGGPRGFVRSYDEGGESFIVLPDYSGNRFYQSLGNVQSDRMAGIVFPNFHTGDMLHVTGQAENLFDEEAQQLMPRITLLTRIRVTGFVLIQKGLNLALRSAEQFSPYNPPVRFLATELQEMGKAAYIVAEADDRPSTATLFGRRRISSTISAFTFKLDRPLKGYVPGAYIILDFASKIEVPYMHMNESAPKLVNDDLVRTWTISAVDPEAPEQVTCTIKRVADGTITRLLHSIEDPSQVQLMVNMVGSGGEFSCFRSDSVSSKMLWIAGGIGITPFLAMLGGLREKQVNTDIVFLFACRDEDNLLLKDIKTLAAGVHLRGMVFQSSGSGEVGGLSGDWQMHLRRLEDSDLKAVADLSEREVFVCGPASLEAAVSKWLLAEGVDSSRIHNEKFTF
eukprot:TRINITY_DN37795_c0_g1_i3.p1 TRINITY_DN37795_c0_g1~~TRINITY_DN37795_c0_g1_i3.p1  ORF type:complete len:621 (-),score=117.33 TRINITY_DN37795_c0_g1_i3:453-2315(-)